MKKLLGWVFNRAVLTAVGLLLLAALIWFGGPLIEVAGYPPLARAWTRGILIGLVFAFVLGPLAWRAWRSSRANARLIEGLTRPAAEAAKEDPEVATLRARFQEAIDLIKLIDTVDLEGGPGTSFCSL
jgi:Uncharacterized protein conserved in bacteria